VIPMLCTASTAGKSGGRKAGGVGK